MEDGVTAIFPTFLAISGLSLLPFLVVMGTAFTKISIVLMLLRNALGVQQAPSSLVINSLALTMTIFIMVPVGENLLQQLQDKQISLQDWDSATELFEIVSSAFQGYLTKHTADDEILFFINSANMMWPESLHDSITRDNIFILLPAHAISEISRAFEIAFLLFLPFVIVDMVVSNVLLSLGAMMVPPMLISLPIKLLLFIAADGWTRLLHSLILSYI